MLISRILYSIPITALTIPIYYSDKYCYLYSLVTSVVIIGESKIYLKDNRYDLISISTIWGMMPFIILSKYKNFWTYKKTIILVLLSDTLQYVGGKILKLGTITPKPFRSISPNKSVGGYVFGIGSIFFYMRNTSSLITIISGCAGDLLLSNVKRKRSFKDFGNILGAHGGFLDRYDGVNFAFVIVSIYEILNNKY